MTTFRRELGVRIKAERKRQSMTARELCRRSGLSPAFVSELENAKRGLGIESAVSIARALGVSVGWLVGEVQ